MRAELLLGAGLLLIAIAVACIDWRAGLAFVGCCLVVIGYANLLDTRRHGTAGPAR